MKIRMKAMNKHQLEGKKCCTLCSMNYTTGARCSASGHKQDGEKYALGFPASLDESVASILNGMEKTTIEGNSD